MCTKCKKDATVYRTNPLGDEKAGWMCIECIKELNGGEISKVVEDVKDIVKVLEEVCIS